MSNAILHKKGRTLEGTVISNRNDKTIVVSVVSQEMHPLLKKYIRRSKKFTAHDPENACSVGDKVEIIEFRPMSASKRWHLVSIVEKAV